jgi:hypothetical protein
MAPPLWQSGNTICTPEIHPQTGGGGGQICKRAENDRQSYTDAFNPTFSCFCQEKRRKNPLGIQVESTGCQKKKEDQNMQSVAKKHSDQIFKSLKHSHYPKEDTD